MQRESYLGKREGGTTPQPTPPGKQEETEEAGEKQEVRRVVRRDLRRAQEVYRSAVRRRAAEYRGSGQRAMTGDLRRLMSETGSSVLGEWFGEAYGEEGGRTHGGPREAAGRGEGEEERRTEERRRQKMRTGCASRGKCWGGGGEVERRRA